MSSRALERLREVIRRYNSCLVAYSGGVDSVLVAVVARQVLGTRSLAVIADSPSLPRSELKEALELARLHDFEVRVIKTQEFDSADYTSNPVNRCYFCKQALFTVLAEMAQQDGFEVIAYGENTSDLGDHRPGAQAASQFHVRAPLKEAGLSKQEVRQLSTELGLPTATKPQMACLSSRIPYGEVVTPDKLSMIEQAEAVLRRLGYREVRVRHHESTDPEGIPARPRASIELGTDELPIFHQRNHLEPVTTALSRIGYADVVLDPNGYRRGSLNADIHVTEPGELHPPQTA